MLDKTESEIMHKWLKDGPPLVTIACTTFNHELYIEDAINGFLSQITDFPFEIIIHDDASTDKTPEIISGYTERYPNIIKAILQTENQLTQKGKNVQINVIACARGSYIAFCEGDDYWTNPEKLQLQISKMHENPACSFSFHPSKIEYIHHKCRYSITARHKNRDTIYTTKELILAGGGFCPFASLIIKYDIFKDIPAWIQGAPVEDYFIPILASFKGDGLYINKIMSTYRTGVKNSWSEKISSNKEFLCMYFNKMLKTLLALDIETRYKYTREITRMRKRTYFFMLRSSLLSCDFKIQLYSQIKNDLLLFDNLVWKLCCKNKFICKILSKFISYMRRFSY